MARERDEVDVRGVQHQLHGEQDDDDVPPNEYAHQSGEEHDRAQDQVVGNGNAHDFPVMGDG